MKRVKKREKKENKKWNKTVEIINGIIAANNNGNSLKYYGYIYLIELVKGQIQNGLFFSDPKLADLAILRESLSLKITTTLFSPNYTRDNLKNITQLLLSSENQGILFGLNENGVIDNLIDLFANSFWKNIITWELLSNNTFIDRLKIMLSDCFVFKAISRHKHESISDETNVVYCPYFLTLFVFRLFVDTEYNFDQAKRIYNKTVGKECKNDLLKFIMQYIAFMIANTIKRINDINGVTINLYDKDDYQSFVRLIKNFRWDNFSFLDRNCLKSKNDLKEKIDQIVISLSAKGNDECENAELLIVEEISGSPVESNDTYQGIKQLWERATLNE